MLLRRSSTTSSRGAVAALPAASSWRPPLWCWQRGLATKKKKPKKELDLGWDALIAPLEACPLPLPSVTSLVVEHGRAGAGHTGARKFKALIPALRWQNPEAQVTQRYAQDDDDAASQVLLELADGSKLQLEVHGQRSEQILGTVMQAVGVPEETVAPGVEWATEFLRERPSTPKQHLLRWEKSDPNAEADEADGEFYDDDLDMAALGDEAYASAPGAERGAAGPA